MIKFVNAKINLGLNVIKRRVDGYHELETLFYPVGLYNGTAENPEPFCDILEVTAIENPSGLSSSLQYETEGDFFHFYGRTIDCPLEKNLVWKALRAFRQQNGMASGSSNLSDRFCISLYKHIPDGAGLGGGSADATFTLQALNELCGNPLSKDDLIHLAASLGADCPFFVENRPVLASGIGEIMTPFSLDLSGYWAVIVYPGIRISTKDAFSGINPHFPERPLSEILKFPVTDWEKEGLKNDFEDHIFEMFPVLPEIKRLLKESGADYAAMSGSGSSVFGIFPSKDLAYRALSCFSFPVFPVKL